MITLNEFDNEGNQTGLWNGKLIKGNKIIGKWSKPNGESTKKIDLTFFSVNYETNKKKIKLKKKHSKEILFGKWWAVGFAACQVYFYDDNTFLYKDGLNNNSKGKYSFSKKYVYLNFDNGKDEKFELGGGEGHSYSLKGDGIIFVKEWEE